MVTAGDDECVDCGGCTDVGDDCRFESDCVRDICCCMSASVRCVAFCASLICAMKACSSELEKAELELDELRALECRDLVLRCRIGEPCACTMLATLLVVSGIVVAFVTEYDILECTAGCTTREGCGILD